jgi:hypothetical protein
VLPAPCMASGPHLNTQVHCIGLPECDVCQQPNGRLCHLSIPWVGGLYVCTWQAGRQYPGTVVNLGPGQGPSARGGAKGADTNQAPARERPEDLPLPTVSAIISSAAPCSDSDSLTLSL